jgi:hypothetical protein
MRKQAILEYPESPLGYKSVFLMVQDAFQTYQLHQASDLIKDLTYGRAAQDAAHFDQKYFSRFQENKAEWKIISDYTSLFHNLAI